MSHDHEMLAGVTLAQLAAIHNSAVENHSLPVAPVSKFPSKAKGIDRIESLATEYGLDLMMVNDAPVLVAIDDRPKDLPSGEEDTDQEPEGDAPTDAELDESQAAADAEGTEPFVKASKEELAAMDAATRAAYRKARRAAARSARKAKAAE